MTETTVQPQIASSSSTGVEHSPQHLKVDGLSPANPVDIGRKIKGGKVRALNCL
jgi:hypothetical protein